MLYLTAYFAWKVNKMHKMIHNLSLFGLAMSLVFMVIYFNDNLYWVSFIFGWICVIYNLINKKIMKDMEGDLQ